MDKLNFLRALLVFISVITGLKVAVGFKKSDLTGVDSVLFSIALALLVLFWG